jgi:hypothetical protein
MIRRPIAILLAALVLIVGLAWADEDGPDKKANPDAAPRLKRKKRAAPPADPSPKRKQGDEGPPKDKQPGREKEKEAEDAIVPEDPADSDPEVDDKEILERISKNMRAVEEKIGNRELGDPTQQQQRDILKDIDSLINRKQQQQGGGAEQQQQQQDQAQQNDQNQEQQQQKQSARQKRRGSSQQQMAQQGKQQGKRQGRAGRQPRQGRNKGKMMAGKQPQQADNQPQPEPQGGNQPGRGGNDPTGATNDPRDPRKDVWGHLRESLRPQMDAYSNPQPFMPRYDDLIKKYYRTIAEQGRKKGD